MFSFYASLVVLRILLAALSPSYVHPDEFHQFSEPTASAALSVAATLPWEYTVHRSNNNNNNNTCHAAPLRSVAAAPLALSAVPTVTLIRPLLPWLPVAWRSGAVAAAPRLALVAGSMLVDVAVLLIAERGVGASVSGADALLALASSHAVLVFHARTFSNAVESIALALLLAVVLLTQTAPRVSMRAVLCGAAIFGAVAAWGVMARFTFVAFAAPAALMALAAAYRRARALRGLYSLAELALVFLAPVVVALVAFCGAVSAMAFVDELWFGTRTLVLAPSGAPLTLHDLVPTLLRPWLWLRVEEPHAPPSPLGSWDAMQRWLSCLAPLNALRYNTQTSNLAEHGIHPRVTHALVNMPLMFGPLALYLAFSALRFVYRRVLQPELHETAPRRAQQLLQQPLADGPKSPLARRRQRLGTVEPPPHDESRLLFVATLLSGLLALSLAPHQEARFLTPLTVPVVLLSCSWLGLSRLEQRAQWSAALLTRWVLWFAFNGALVLLLGVAHQGGVLRALSHLYTTAAATTSVGAASTPVAGSGASDGPATVLFYATYTPPLHLLLQSDARVPRDERVQGTLVPNTYDVFSVPRGALHAALDAAVTRQLNRAIAQNAAPTNALSGLRLFVVAPEPALASLRLVPLGGALRSLVAPIITALEDAQTAAGSGGGDGGGGGARHDVAAAQLAHARAQLSKQLVTMAQVDAAGRHLGGAWQPALEYQLSDAEQFWPHVSFEDLPASLDDATLWVARLRVRIVALEHQQHP